MAIASSHRITFIIPQHTVDHTHNDLYEFLVPSHEFQLLYTVLLASISKGESTIEYKDTNKHTVKLLLTIIRNYGISVKFHETQQIIQILGQYDSSRSILREAPHNVIHVGSSLILLYFCVMIASIAPGYTIITGNSNILSHNMKEIILILRQLGVDIFSSRNNACPPLIIKGTLQGGHTVCQDIAALPLVSLLSVLPLTYNNSIIELTSIQNSSILYHFLSFFQKQNIRYSQQNYQYFVITGKQYYTAEYERIYADPFVCIAHIIYAIAHKLPIKMANIEQKVLGEHEVLHVLELLGIHLQWQQSEVELSIIPSMLRKVGHITIIDMHILPWVLGIILVMPRSEAIDIECHLTDTQCESVQLFLSIVLCDITTIIVDKQKITVLPQSAITSCIFMKEVLFDELAYIFVLIICASIGSEVSTVMCNEFQFSYLTTFVDQINAFLTKNNKKAQVINAHISIQKQLL